MVRHTRFWHAPTIAFAMATVVSIRPVATLMEPAAATATVAKQNNKNGETTTSSCPSYGCPLYPQDVYYDPPVKEALTQLRLLKRDDVVTETLEEPLQSSIQNHDMATLTLIGYKGGTMEEQINQDRAFCVAPYIIIDTNNGDESRSTKNNKDNKLLGVFDGHARLGEQVSQYTVTELPKLLATKLSAIDDDGEEQQQQQITQALIETFIEMDQTAPAEISGGCTASVILQQGQTLYFANAGDSRSFLVVYRAKRQSVQVAYITREDKPHLLDERARVEKMGGQVYNPLQGTSRVLYTDPETGMQSGLAMSRSIGDWEVGKLGVIPDPIVDVIDIPELVEAQMAMDCDVVDPDDGVVSAECLVSSDDVYIFAVSATDGMMDFATPEEIAQTVALSLYGKEGPHLLTALEQLIYKSAQGWEQSKAGRYRDDIAVAVSQIRIPPAPAPPSQ
jgi:serine/threonine protein phosphatase PrpC